MQEAHKPTRKEGRERADHPAPKAEPEGRNATRTEAPATRNTAKERAGAACIAGVKKGKGKGNERKAATSQQASKPTKKGTPPPIARGRQPFPSTKIRAKKSAKSRLG